MKTKPELKQQKTIPIETGEIKPIAPLFNQIVLRVLGNHCGTYLGNDVFYLVRAIYILLSDLGENYVEAEWKKLGRDWTKTKKNLEKLDKRATEVKAFYDSIEDKRGDKKDKEVKIKRYYIKTASKIPILLPEAYDLFVFLAKKTPIHRQTIPSDAFKILEHAGRKTLELGKKPVQKTIIQQEVSQTSD